MMTFMKIIIIIIVIVFHDDDIDENHHEKHHDNHRDCLSKLSVLGHCERLLGRVGGATFLIFEQCGWVVDEIVLMR